MAHSQDDTSSSSTTSSSTTRVPLVFLSTGASGVGKTALAQALAVECGMSFIELDIEAYDTVHQQQQQLQQRISSLLLETYPQGEVVVVLSLGSGGGDMGVSTKEQHRVVLQSLSKMVVSDSPTTYPWHSTIFIMESLAGEAIIHKTIRHFGLEYIPVVELVEYLRQELLPEEEEEEEGGGGETTPPLAGDNPAGPLLTVSAILPFVPLTTLVVDELFQAKLGQRGYVMTNPFHRQAILEQTFLEWQTWIHKPTQTQLLTTLAKGGGHDVNRLVERLLSPLMEKHRDADYEDSSFTCSSAMASVNADVEEESYGPTTTSPRQRQQQQHQPLRHLEFIAALEMGEDASSSLSSSTHVPQLRVLTCVSTMTTSTPLLDDCTELCQYPLL